MFVDLPGGGLPPPEPPAPRISPKGEKVLIWLLCLNMIMLLVAPIGGATVVMAVIALLR